MDDPSSASPSEDVGGSGLRHRPQSLADELSEAKPVRQRKHVDPRATSDESDLDQLLGDEDSDAQSPSKPKDDVVSKLTKALPQGSDKMGALIDPLLEQLPPRWRNWVVRGIFTIVMVSFFTFIVSKGPMWLMLLVFAIQFKCFQEIISIGLAVYRLYDFPWFRALSWYFLFASNYFFFGENLIDYWAILLRKDNFLTFLVAYHRMISFALYCLGFVWFVLSLKKGYYMRQFSLFAWSHVGLLLIVTQSFLIIQNIFHGIIWFLVPVAMIICCDVMSYMFGFFWGKTPLIKLSPKKTWEGFIGGAFSTVVFGLVLSYALLGSPFMTCPVEDYTVENTNCTIPPVFQLQEYNLPRPFSWSMKILRKPPTAMFYPFLFHSVFLALFASILGPFGGFFASGFKRAFKIKDFGDVIPGHGGLMDRFDCQLLMGTFVNVYIHTFIRMPNPGKLINQVFLLPVDDQLTVFNALKEELQRAGLV